MVYFLTRFHIRTVFDAKIRIRDEELLAKIAFMKARIRIRIKPTQNTRTESLDYAT